VVVTVQCRVFYGSYLVREGLEVHGSRGDLLLGGVESMGKVTTGREVETHNAVVWQDEAGVGREVGSRPRVRLRRRQQVEREGKSQGESQYRHLHVDTPLGVVEAEGCECTLDAERLHLVDNLRTNSLLTRGLDERTRMPRTTIES